MCTVAVLQNLTLQGGPSRSFAHVCQSSLRLLWSLTQLHAPWGSLEVQLSDEDRIKHAVAIADGCVCCSLCRVRGGFERFYCGAPLVAANGHRLGTMCLGGSQPKTMDAEQVQSFCQI